MPDEVAAAAEAKTMAWCETVAALPLCPWARRALAADGAVRVVVSAAEDLDALESACVAAAKDVCASRHDADVAIVFVVVPNYHPGDFDAFRIDVETLEDERFPRAPPVVAGSECLADDVQLAPFHPGWLWSGGFDDDDPIHFDKRAPYPTISLVQVAGLDGMDSESVAATNEAVLAAAGRERLAATFAAFAARHPPPGG